MHFTLPRYLRTLRETFADFVYGIDAANAIRHGLQPSPRRTARNTR
ncbi:hypothetical protein HLB23_01720 [Nocardia uniformis]|uniref:Uncharacterized protein n=1 Tax=Nocardia uniformis TaxID=53432 RepID=A0A849C0T9_9NOCA|nr:hypothetical protein [Nocardia uniformis]NNH68609.1 hypothetical protein [Nocardia uniformis]